MSAEDRPLPPNYSYMLTLWGVYHKNCYIHYHMVCNKGLMAHTEYMNTMNKLKIITSVKFSCIHL